MDEERVERYVELCIKKVRIGDSTLWFTTGVEKMQRRLQAVEDEQDELIAEMTAEEALEARVRYRKWFREYIRR